MSLPRIALAVCLLIVGITYDFFGMRADYGAQGGRLTPAHYVMLREYQIMRIARTVTAPFTAPASPETPSDPVGSSAETVETTDVAETAETADVPAGSFVAVFVGTVNGLAERLGNISGEPAATSAAPRAVRRGQGKTTAVLRAAAGVRVNLLVQNAQGSKSGCNGGHFCRAGDRSEMIAPRR